MIKFKLPKITAPDNASQGGPASATTPSSSGFKIKLNTSQPPTPLDAPTSSVLPSSTEKKKRTYTKRVHDDGTKGKKRAIDDDIISPAAKRIQSGPGRKLSIKLGPSQADHGSASASRTPLKRKPTVPKIIDIRARQRAPQRAKGLGYDSEDSDVEKDPAIQQALVLRMTPGEDADYLRQAILDGKIGPHVSTGDADVSLKFVERNYRRAVVRVRSNLYAAVLVDLPCIVETMKSFDRKGWYKVADCCQMLLVLGRCTNDEEAKNFPLPNEIAKTNFQYPHGLTAPLRNVRKRRWRHRPNHNDAMEAEEIVHALLEADRQVESTGGTCTISTKKNTFQAMSAEQQDETEDDDGDADADAEREAVETVEGDGTHYEGYEDYEDDEDDGGELEAQLAEQMGLADGMENGLGEGIVDSPAALVDGMGSGPPSAAVSPTPESTPAAEAPSQDDQTSDDDDSDEDEDNMDVFDEDAAAQSAERAQQMEEVADLEQEIARTRQKANAMTNQLLKQREMRKLAGLEEDLKAKKVIFGLEEE